MMYKTLIAAVVLTILSCQAQKEKKKPITKEKTMEYFDINKYKNLPLDPEKIGNDPDLYYKFDNKKIGILSDDESTQVTETFTNSPYGKVKIYRKRNGLLYREIEKFYDFAIGINKEYNEIGELVKVKNYDEPYKLSVTDLAKKLKEEYNLDIMDPNNVFLLRRKISQDTDSLPIYTLLYKDKTDIMKLYYYVINATTGAVLYTTTTYISEGGKGVNNYDDFVKDYQAKKAKATEIYTIYKGKSYTREQWEKYEKEWHEEDDRKKNKKK